MLVSFGKAVGMVGSIDEQPTYKCSQMKVQVSAKNIISVKCLKNESDGTLFHSSFIFLLLCLQSVTFVA